MMYFSKSRTVVTQMTELSFIRMLPKNRLQIPTLVTPCAQPVHCRRIIYATVRPQRPASPGASATQWGPVGHLLRRFMGMGRSAFYCFYSGNVRFTNNFYYLLIDSKCLLSIE